MSFKIKTVELEHVCGITSQLPANTLPEAAFVGRSNVGKSSLINSLTGRKSLARTSSKPGKTQTINFYNVNNSIYIVDLPGYGYANAPKNETQKWGDMVAKYIDKSETLEVIFLLVDIRHPASKLDVSMFEWINYMEFQPVVIATKADKLSKGGVKKQVEVIRKSLGAASDTIILPYSSQTGQGREDILDFLEQIIGWNGS